MGKQKTRPDPCLRWRLSNRVAEFTDEGKLIRFDVSAGADVDGFFCLVGTELVQIYQRVGVLKLFAHDREFDLSDPQLRAIYLSLPIAEFLLLRTGLRPVLKLSRWLGTDALEAIADPTGDRIDFESERFLLTCARLVNDKWRQFPTISQWSTGTRPEAGQ